MSYYYESKADSKDYSYVNRKTGPHTALHFHSAIELLIVRAGKMEVTARGESFTVSSGEGCFIDSFSPHSCTELEKDTDVYAFVGSPDFFEPIFNDIGGVPDVKFKFEDFSLLDKLTELYFEASSDILRRSYFKGAAALIIARIAETSPLVMGGERSTSGDICAILQYIQGHFTEDISLVSLAAEFGYSPQYFSRLFHKYMKVNLTEYINIARVNRAKKLLSSGESVATIAFECGFGSMPSFYRAYKKVFGELPRG